MVIVLATTIAMASPLVHQRSRVVHIGLKRFVRSGKTDQTLFAGLTTSIAVPIN